MLQSYGKIPFVQKITIQLSCKNQLNTKVTERHKGTAFHLLTFVSLVLFVSFVFKSLFAVDHNM